MATIGPFAIHTDDDQEDGDFFDQLASEFGNVDLAVLHRGIEQEDGERLDQAFSKLSGDEGRSSTPASGIAHPIPQIEDNPTGDEFWLEENLVQENYENEPIIRKIANSSLIDGSRVDVLPCNAFKDTEVALSSGAVQAEASASVDTTDQADLYTENKAPFMESGSSDSVEEGPFVGAPLRAVAEEPECQVEGGVSNSVCPLAFEEGTVAPGKNIPQQEARELDFRVLENMERELVTVVNSAPVKDAVVSDCPDDDVAGAEPPINSSEAFDFTLQSSVSVHRDSDGLQAVQNKALAPAYVNQSVQDSTSDGVPTVFVNADVAQGYDSAVATPSPTVKELKWSSFGDTYNFSSYLDFYSSLGYHTEGSSYQETFISTGAVQVDSLLEPSFPSTQATSNAGVESSVLTSFYSTAGDHFDETSIWNQQDIFDQGIRETKSSSVNDAASFGSSPSVEVKQSGLASAEGGANYTMGSTNYEAQVQDETIYPGWYFDYASNQWKQVEGCKVGNADYLQPSQTGEVVGMALDPIWQTSHGQTGYSASGLNEGLVGMQAAKNYHQATSETTAEQQANWEQQYPGWYYDYQAQQWWQMSDESQSWASNQDNKHDSSQVLVSANTSRAPEGGWLEQQAKPRYESEVNPNIYLPDGSQNLYSSSGDTGMNVLARGMSFNSCRVPAVGDSDIGQQGADITRQGNNTGSWAAFPGIQSVVPNQSYQSVPNTTYESQTDHHVEDKSAFLSTSYGFFQPQTISGGAMERAHSCAGRPAHALMAFGFGGKLVTLKAPRLGASEPMVLQDLHQLVLKAERRHENDGFSYFSALNRNGLNGPLVGHRVLSKDLLKWVDAQIENCEKGDFHGTNPGLRVLWGILKIACLHHGKLRSVAGSGLQVEDGPEVALGRLLMAAKSQTRWAQGLAMSLDKLQSMPTVHQMQVAADEVRSFLMDGKRKEALHLALQGQLWGLALVLAWQLGEKVYSETVLQMAQLQFPPGSPLRTLLLLFAGQTTELFKVQSLSSSAGAQGPFFSTALSNPQDSAGGMLNDWLGNLSIIAANPTKGDEQVIIHLGDSLWKDQGEVAGAHACYLVAETGFESFSKDARLCLVGADHFKYQRTFASPQAIQRTELYEYAKSLGNPQYVSVPFQPFKLLYAHMLAESGKITEACRYCQTVAKGLKNAGCGVDIEFCKHSAMVLEERLRQHSQGGYSLNYSTVKFVGKVMGTIDNTIHKIIGGPPVPPAPQASPAAFSSPQDWNGNNIKFRDAGGYATKADPSTPLASISNLFSVNSQVDVPTPNSNTSIRHEIYKTTTATSPETAVASSKQPKSDGAGYLGRFGSQFFSKALGFVKHSKEAKLGDENKFYYDEKLKRWVETGVEQTTEEATLAPPPIIAGFNSSFGTPSTDSNSGRIAEGQQANVSPSVSADLPPIPPSINQFSARGRLSGVRSRYVDTFNEGNAEPEAKPSPSPIILPSGGRGMVSTPTQFFALGPVTSTYASGQVSANGHIYDGSPDFTKLVLDNKISEHEPVLPKNLATSFMNVGVIQKHSSASDIAMLTSKELTPDEGGTNGISIPGNMGRAVSWSGAPPDAIARSTHANHRFPNGNVRDIVPMEASLPSPPVIESIASITGNKSIGMQAIATGNMLAAYDEMQEVEL